ncbi:MAG: hypothetical protein LBU85_11285 [Treponema sp.]|nr:hypothetical protein [Treponema sp.]
MFRNLAAGLQISMTEEMLCYENAVAERVNGILKQEYCIGSCFRNKDQAKEAVKDLGLDSFLEKMIVYYKHADT